VRKLRNKDILKVLREIAEYGIPEEILTDHGTQFVAAKSREKVKHILARVRLRESEKFGSVEAVVGWHNEIKPHRSLEWDELCNAFWCKLPPD